MQTDDNLIRAMLTPQPTKPAIVRRQKGYTVKPLAPRIHILYPAEA